MSPIAILAMAALALTALIALCLHQTIPQFEQTVHVQEEAILPQITKIPPVATQTQASINLQLPTASQPSTPVWHPCIAKAQSHLNQHPVLFEASKTNLRAPALTRLTQLTHILAQCPDIPIRIMGHTDAQGLEESNLEISLQRAKKAIQFMVSQGLNSKRLSAGGAGSSQPASNNESATSQALNRRIELVF